MEGLGGEGGGFGARVEWVERGRGEEEVRVRWLCGGEVVVFESFCGWVRRVVVVGGG